MSDPVPAPAPAPKPVPAPAPAEDPAGHIGRLEAELAELRTAAIAGAKAVLRVLPPHSAFTWGGVTVTDQPTQVPAHAVPGLMEAAANAKPPVNLTQEH